MDVALVRPVIPQNTGSIARTCAATGTPLHLVGELGFDISEKAVRRAGLDYWEHVSLTQHNGWQSFQDAMHNRQMWLFTKFATIPYWDVRFSKEDVLVFGSETTGLGEAILSETPKECQLSIPISCPGVRSLNLSNAVSIGLYEALRQIAQY